MMKKRTLALLLGVAMAFGLTACGGGESAPAEDTAEGTEQTQTEETKAPEKEVYKIGETWTVDGQWSLTITGVTATDERNEYEETNPAAVYIVDYTYTNDGYVDATGYMNGLYLDVGGMVVDNAGQMGYYYGVNTTYFPQETPVGASCKAQMAFGVDNAGDFELTVVQYDGNDEEQKATFQIDVQ